MQNCWRLPNCNEAMSLHVATVAGLPGAWFPPSCWTSTTKAGNTASALQKVADMGFFLGPFAVAGKTDSQVFTIVTGGRYTALL
jgi:hypothetical protein